MRFRVFEYSKEAWCVHGEIGLLAEQLLTQGGPQYVDDYLIGRGQSFDATMGSSVSFLGKESLTACLHEIERKLQQPLEPEQKRRLENGLEQFSEWILYAADEDEDEDEE